MDNILQPCEESNNSSEIRFTPEVKNEVIPKITQEFKSLDDVFTYYNNYAFESGFSVRIHSSKTDKKNGETIRKEYVCSKQGESICSEFPSGVKRKQKSIWCSFNSRLVLRNKKKLLGCVRAFDRHCNIVLGNIREMWTKVCMSRKTGFWRKISGKDF
ncbi:hypothetical protein RHMOL_Rhmol01G0051500 [Rhododendron molle]|uniref:Uncharacterized protein n=1 Tax=Rhododendron molle TaxID=49168 RepID=A0ACC0Q1I2_RHOML|nr:hypothetical protein RHMOL_Rhmol01G0051500 [Rhododendron molle]